MDLMFQPLRKYADFRGRARRSEYWLFTLFTILVQLAASLLISLTGGGEDPFANPLSTIIACAYFLFLLYLFVPSVAVGFRRLHDTNRSAWWLLINLLPFLGWLVFLIFTLLDGTPGDNRFGPDPKGRDPGAAVA